MPLLVKNLKVRYSGDRMEEYVILVDQNDNPVGKEKECFSAKIDTKGLEGVR